MVTFLSLLFLLDIQRDIVFQLPVVEIQPWHCICYILLSDYYLWMCCVLPDITPFTHIIWYHKAISLFTYGTFYYRDVKYIPAEDVVSIGICPATVWFGLFKRSRSPHISETPNRAPQWRSKHKNMIPIFQTKPSLEKVAGTGFATFTRKGFRYK